MNKSKFLKKSLAMLLAVMMIVAMIPLSASAAATPVISSVTVNGAEATLSGTTYTAEINNTASVSAEIVLLNGSGSVYHDGEGSLTATNGVYTVTFTADEISAKAAEIAVFDADDNLAATYVIKYTVGAKDTDTSVKSVTIDGQYGATVYNGSEIVITVPYGTQPSAGSALTAKVVLNSNKSHVASDAAGLESYNVSVASLWSEDTQAGGVDFTVTAESGATRTYTIKAVIADAFTSFSVTGERKEAKIDVYNKAITVYMPYGTNASTAATPAFKFVPNYVTGYNSVVVKANKTGSGTETWKTGTEYNLASYATLTSGATIDTKSFTLTLSYTNGVTENWTVKFDVPAANPVAEISTLKIGNFVGEINGKNITVKVPANVRSAATDIVLGLSTASKVDVVGTTIKATGDSDTATLTSTAGWLADGKNNFTLRVTAGTTNDDGVTDVQDYNLTIVTAEAETAKLTEMVLEDAKGNQYTASIDQTSGKVLFNLPYAVQKAADVNGWKLFWSITSGSTIQSNGADLAVTGAALAGTEGFLPAGGTGYNGTAAASKGAQSIVVATTEHNSKTYTVYFKNVAASTAATLTDVSITTVSDTDNITDTNTYKLSGSRELSVTIPYSKYVDYNQAYLTGTLSDGAELYYIDSSNKFQSIALSDADGSGTQLPSINTYKYDGVTKTAGQLTPLTLVVVSEGIDITAGTATYDSAWKQANVKKGYSVYTLTVKQAAAKTAAELTSVSLYNADTKETVKGVISGDQIKFTLPAYFADGHAADWDDAIYFDFAVASGDAYVTFNTVWTTGAALKPLAFDTNGVATDAATVTADATNKVIKTTNATPANITKVFVKSEDTKNTNEYNVNVEFANAEPGADLTSVTINKVTARPVGNKVTINLPYGTEITHLTPSFAVSKNAYVTDSSSAVNANATAYNFTATQKFVVHSEDGKNTSEYYITVTTDDEFSDVKPNDWFYQDVMDGVAAGIIAGVGNGKFDPNGKVTRAQFAQFIARADGYEKDAYLEKSVFSDVKAGTDAAAAIAYCSEKGYITGRGNTKFDPNANITRQEMAIIICKVKGLTPVSSPKAKFADDASIVSWAKGYVYACCEGGYMSGMGNNKFAPRSNATRAQAASVIVRNMK